MQSLCDGPSRVLNAARLATNSSRPSLLLHHFLGLYCNKLEESDRPPLHVAFEATHKIPMTYPPEAAVEVGRQAANMQREIARRSGYDVPHRMRPSSLASKASKLRFDVPKVERGEIYDIADDLYGEQPTAEDQKLRNRAKNERHRATKQRKGIPRGRKDASQRQDLFDFGYHIRLGPR